MEGYRIRDEKKAHFVTFTVVDWVDVFTRSIYRDIVLESMRFCVRNKGLIVYCYVIMSNHIHLIIQAENGKLSDLIRDMKAFMARTIINTIKTENESRADWMLKRFEFAAKSNKRNEHHQFWKYGNHPEEVFSEPFFWTKTNYIHMNPVRARWVRKASDYIYSSATNYVGKESIFKEIQLMSPPIVTEKSQDWVQEMQDW